MSGCTQGSIRGNVTNHSSSVDEGWYRDPTNEIAGDLASQRFSWLYNTITRDEDLVTAVVPKGLRYNIPGFLYICCIDVPGLSMACVHVYSLYHGTCLIPSPRIHAIQISPLVFCFVLCQAWGALRADKGLLICFLKTRGQELLASIEGVKFLCWFEIKFFRRKA